MDLNIHCEKILKLLSKNKNVLIVGPPATGKSKLLSLVASKFSGTTSPGLQPANRAPIPAANLNIEPWMPSPQRTANRKVFSITFHQGTKHRDFVSGIMPRLGEGQTGFAVMNGILSNANQNASSNGASLVIIDEMNRGPAVTIFGDTLSCIEADKRLNDSDQQIATSAPFYTYDATSTLRANYLSSHLYILALMNEADTSVEPLDVAFLRRFETYRLEPDADVLYQAFSIMSTTAIPEVATEKSHVLAALVKAWLSVNERIAIGKGDAFRLGQGVMLYNAVPSSLEDTLVFAAQCWRRIEAHVREIFYANDRSQAVVFNASAEGLYSLKEVEFGEQEVSKIVTRPWDESNIYSLLKQVSGNG